MGPTIQIDPLAANGFGVGKVELYDAYVAFCLKMECDVWLTDLHEQGTPAI